MHNACFLADIPFMVGRGCLEVYLPLVSQLSSWNYFGLLNILFLQNRLFAWGDRRLIVVQHEK